MLFCGHRRTIDQSTLASSLTIGGKWICEVKSHAYLSQLKVSLKEDAPALFSVCTQVELCATVLFTASLTKNEVNIM